MAAREGETAWKVIVFKEVDGTAPLLEWFDRLNSPTAVARCRAVIELLRGHGNQLRRPHADALREGIRELRARVDQVQCRMLYFFHGRRRAVITHGIIKPGDKVPPKEIDRAIAYRERFEADPQRHTYLEE